MDLSTTYLGFKLANPLIPGASPICNDMLFVRRLAEAGAPMIIMHSVFQEQFDLEERAVNRALDESENSSAEARSYLPAPDQFRLGPEEYLEQIGRIKSAVKIPVVASLNGHTPGGWIDYATQIQKAGADALELNIYDPVFDLETSSAQLEARTIDLVRKVRQAVRLPLAVKLSQNYTALPHFAKKLCSAGADALVLFNRFYQSDIDINNLEVRQNLHFSTSEELLPRLRWTAALAGRINCDLAITGGVRTAEDVIKAIMVGANTVQIVSSLLEYGSLFLRRLCDDVQHWLQSHEYSSLAQMKGTMSLLKTPNPTAFERANYMKILQAWEPA